MNNAIIPEMMCRSTFWILDFRFWTKERNRAASAATLLLHTIGGATEITEKGPLGNNWVTTVLYFAF
jgi:hypothetical protein